ncbi:MAG: hypothetical protein IPF99_21985 [Deltaproteobacteria bacterium]|nr:hypothetical protein [Deltaproteobacteria bacterium]
MAAPAETRVRGDVEHVPGGPQLRGVRVEVVERPGQHLQERVLQVRGRPGEREDPVARSEGGEQAVEHGAADEARGAGEEDVRGAAGRRGAAGEARVDDDVPAQGSQERQVPEEARVESLQREAKGFQRSTSSTTDFQYRSCWGRGAEHRHRDEKSTAW